MLQISRQVAMRASYCASMLVFAPLCGLRPPEARTACKWQLSERKCRRQRRLGRRKSRGGHSRRACNASRRAHCSSRSRLCASRHREAPIATRFIIIRPLMHSTAHLGLLWPQTWLQHNSTNRHNKSKHKAEQVQSKAKLICAPTR